LIQQTDCPLGNLLPPTINGTDFVTVSVTDLSS
jgi:hypothetical protein